MTYILITRSRSPSITTQSQNISINTSATKEKININTCSKEALESLPHIGSKLAQKIIDNRPYTSIYGLKNIKGIDDKIINDIKETTKYE